MKEDWLEIEGDVLKNCFRYAEGAITIPDGVTKIGAYCFSNCSRLQKVVFSKNVEVLEEGAFANCESLSEIVIPDNVKVIGKACFYNTNPKYVHLPAGIEMDESCFMRPRGFGERDKEPTIITVSDINWREKPGEYSNWCSYCVPDFDIIKVSAGTKKLHLETDFNAETIEFLGDIPESIEICSSRSIKHIRINSPRKCVCGENLDKLVEEVKRYDRNKDILITYAAPDLCLEESTIPGYIKVTSWKNEDVVEINTKYILSIAPHELENLFTPMTGTEIFCNSVENNYPSGTVFIVYESPEIVAEKIKKSLENLGKSVGGIGGLVNQLEILCKGGL